MSGRLIFLHWFNFICGKDRGYRETFIKQWIRMFIVNTMVQVSTLYVTAVAIRFIDVPVIYI